MPQTTQHAINLDDLFADIAHKFKTPLAVCLNNIELAQLKIAHGQIAEARRVLDRSFRSINSLSFTCSQAIDDCRINSFRQSDKQVFNLSDCANQAVQDFQILLDGRKLISGIEPNINFYGHQIQITELILNILDNAVKFTDAKLGIISVSLSVIPNLIGDPGHGRVLDSRLRGNDKRGDGNEAILLSISDNGSGISKDHLARLFDRHFQSRTKTGSAGLGLYLCQKIVKNHSGTIEIKSEINKETCVIVTLPPD